MSENDDTGSHQGNTVQANGLKIYYEEYGSGQPLLLLHGGASTGRGAWGAIAPQLAPHFRVFTPDSRGHGRTPNPAGELSFSLMARDVVAFAHALGLESPLICGWSDGGYIALEIAIEHPGFARAIVANGVGFVCSEQHLANARAFLRVGEGNRVDTGQLAREMPGFVEYLKSWQSPEDDSEQWMNFIQQLADLWLAPFDLSATRLRTISVPTLVFNGDRDDDSPMEEAVAAYLSIPQGELAVAPCATHMLALDNPDLFARTILEFFLRHSDPGVSG